MFLHAPLIASCIVIPTVLWIAITAIRDVVVGDFRMDIIEEHFGMFAYLPDHNVMVYHLEHWNKWTTDHWLRWFDTLKAKHDSQLVYQGKTNNAS